MSNGINNLWWKKGIPHPNLGKRKPASKRSLGQPQTYDNYYKDYRATPNGYAAHYKAQVKYRNKIKAMYGTYYGKARLLHKKSKEQP